MYKRQNYNRLAKQVEVIRDQLKQLELDQEHDKFDRYQRPNFRSQYFRSNKQHQGNIQENFSGGFRGRYRDSRNMSRGYQDRGNRGYRDGRKDSGSYGRRYVRNNSNYYREGSRQWHGSEDDDSDYSEDDVQWPRRACYACDSTTHLVKDCDVIRRFKAMDKGRVMQEFLSTCSSDHELSLIHI